MCSVRGFLGSCYGSFFFNSIMLMLFSLSSLAADTGWLTMPDNDHAQVRLRLTSHRQAMLKYCLRCN